MKVLSDEAKKNMIDMHSEYQTVATVIPKTKDEYYQSKKLVTRTKTLHVNSNLIDFSNPTIFFKKTDGTYVINYVLPDRVTDVKALKFTNVQISDKIIPFNAQLGSRNPGEGTLITNLSAFVAAANTLADITGNPDYTSQQDIVDKIVPYISFEDFPVYWLYAFLEGARLMGTLTTNSYFQHEWKVYHELKILHTQGQLPIVNMTGSNGGGFPYFTNLTPTLQNVSTYSTDRYRSSQERIETMTIALVGPDYIATIVTRQPNILGIGDKFYISDNPFFAPSLDAYDLFEVTNKTSSDTIEAKIIGFTAARFATFSSPQNGYGFTMIGNLFTEYAVNYIKEYTERLKQNFVKCHVYIHLQDSSDEASIITNDSDLTDTIFYSEGKYLNPTIKHFFQPTTVTALRFSFNVSSYKDYSVPLDIMLKISTENGLWLLHRDNQSHESFFFDVDIEYYEYINKDLQIGTENLVDPDFFKYLGPDHGKYRNENSDFENSDSDSDSESDIDSDDEKDIRDKLWARRG